MEEREEEDVRDAEVETMMDNKKERTGAAEEGEKGDVTQRKGYLGREAVLFFRDMGQRRGYNLLLEFLSADPRSAWLVQDNVLASVASNTPFPEGGPREIFTDQDD